MVLERGVAIHPSLIEAAPRLWIDKVIDHEFIVPNIFDLLHEFVVLRDIVGVVEWLGNRILVGRGGLAVGVGRGQLDILHDAIAEGAIAWALHIAKQCAGWLSASPAIGAVRDQDAGDVIPIAGQLGLEPEFKSGLVVPGRIVGELKLDRGRTCRDKIVRPETGFLRRLTQAQSRRRLGRHHLPKRNRRIGRHPRRPVRPQSLVERQVAPDDLRLP